MPPVPESDNPAKAQRRRSSHTAPHLPLPEDVEMNESARRLQHHHESSRQFKMDESHVDKKDPAFVEDVDFVEDKDKEDAEPIEPSMFSDEKGNLKFVNMVVRCPCTILFIILLLCVLVSVLLVAIVFKEGNPFSDPGNDFDLYDVRTVQLDSLRLARDVVEGQRDALQNQDAEIRVQSQDQDITYWVFESQTPEGVFGTAESIEAMKDAFDIFLADAEYSKYCKLEYTQDNEANSSAPVECQLPLSPLNMYFASEWDTEMVAAVIEVLKDSEKVELFNTLALCYTRGLYCEAITNEASEEDIMFTRTLSMNLTKITDAWDMGGPLVQNFTQVTELASYLMNIDVYKGFVDFGYDKGFHEIDEATNQTSLISMFSRGIVFWGSPLNVRTEAETDVTLDEEEKNEQDEEDLKTYVVDNFLDEMNDQATDSEHESINSYYFMGSLILEVLLAIVQRDGMLAIFSLVFVFIWIRVNTGSWFLAGIGIAEVFFSLPVAWFIFAVIFRIKYFAFLNALCVFIVAAIGADDIFIFMDAYKQSAHRNPENLVSMETRMSWVYRRTGNAMAITSATTCAAFLCTLITPLVQIKSFGIFAAVVIFIDYVLVMTLFCTAVVVYHDRYEDRACMGCCCTTCTKTDPSPTSKAKESLETSEEYKGDRVSNFFRVKVAGFIQVPLHRAVLGVLFLTWIAVATWQTTKIEATKESEQFLDEDHPLQKSITILNNEFPTADDDLGLKVYYTWGLGEVDRSGVNALLDPDNLGTPTFLDTFDFNEECQTELLKTCDKLKTDPNYEPYIKRKGGLGSTFCFVEELAAYSVKGNLDDCEYVSRAEWKNETWQISPSNLPDVMKGFVQQYSCAEQTQTIMSYYANEIGWDGVALRYAAISVESQNLDPFSQQPEGYTRDNYDFFVSVADELDATVSQYCTGDVIMTDLDAKFAFMNNQAIYVRTAIQGAVLGVGIAFVVLLIATRVLHIAFFASLSIICVLVSVTGMMVMLGWNLGSIESILISIIAGFSVDYVVHLAHAYEVSPGDTYERITAAFGDMGISVMNGMITSVVASIPLFFCQLQFFAKFGTFLCLTIAFSWIFANFAFMSVLASLGIPIKENGGFCRF